MRSDSVRNMSTYADQNHAPSLAVARLELPDLFFLYHTTQEEKKQTIPPPSMIPKFHCLPEPIFKFHRVFPVAERHHVLLQLRIDPLFNGYGIKEGLPQVTVFIRL